MATKCKIPVIDFTSSALCENINPINIEDIGAVGAIYAPYASIEFNVDGEIFKVTVGNNSAAKAENRACITSFQYGFEVDNTGLGAEIEIIDHGGLLAKPLTLAIKKSIAKLENVTIDFGWIIKSESNNVGFISTPKKINVFIQRIDESIEGSSTKYKLNLKTQLYYDRNTSFNMSFGTEKQKISLKKAIIECLKLIDCTPVFLDKNGKEFLDLEKNADGTINRIPAFRFPVAGAGPAIYDGPLNAWKCNNQSPLNVIRNWLNQITTLDGRGVIFQAAENNPKTIIFREAYNLETDCTINLEGFDRPISYVVNGGNCSPVLEFNPSFSWFGIGGPFVEAGGVSGGPNTAKQIMNQDQQSAQDKNSDKDGPLMIPTIHNDQINWRPPMLTPEETSKAVQAQFNANKDGENLSKGGGIIDAELKIIGDVRYVSPSVCYSGNITILVVNPFYNQQCKWITKSNLNSALTSSLWRIFGVSHSVSEAAFITTLKLKLFTPNISVDADKIVNGFDLQIKPTDINKQELIA